MVPSTDRTPPTSAAPVSRPGSGRVFLRRATLAVATLYGAALLLGWAAVTRLGERTWWTTLLVFAPRFMLLGPLGAIAIIAAFLRQRRLLAALGFASLLVMGPIMGGEVPWTPGTREPGLVVRVLTLNRGVGRLDEPRLNDLIEREAIDVLCFQEIEPAGFTTRVAARYHWNSDRRIASRFPILHEDRPEVSRCNREDDLFLRMPIVTLQGPNGVIFRVALIDTPSMTEALSAVRSGRFSTQAIVSQSDCRRRYAQTLAAVLPSRPEKLLIAGDFNTPPGSDVLAPFDRRYVDSFARVGAGFGFTWPRSHPFLRVDRIMATPDWSFRRSEVGPDVGSDHLPIWAEAVLPSAAP